MLAHLNQATDTDLESHLDWIRTQFPALSQTLNGQSIAFLDGPGGTQIPQTVIDAMSHYLRHTNANAHGAFATSLQTDQVIQQAHEAISDFLGCNLDEVVFGPNMTTLTFAFSRAIGRDIRPGDEIIVTRVDHDANVAPWRALEEQGAIVHTVDIHPEDCTLDMDDFVQKLSPRTRLVAAAYASNAVGTINNIAAIVQLAHEVGAWAFVDAVHYAAHGPIDVKDLDCEFLACSPYKFYGPHLGVLYGKRELLERLRPYKVRPAPNAIPARWETGTQNHEGLAGLIATITYLAALGQRLEPTGQTRRMQLVKAMTAMHKYGSQLCRQLITGLQEIPDITIYGITDLRRIDERVSTIAIRKASQSPAEVAQRLAQEGIFVWHGNFYALGLTERLGVEDKGGLVRIGMVHYNTRAEVDRLLQVLKYLNSENQTEV